MSQISCPTVGPQLVNAKEFVRRQPSMVVRAVTHGLKEASTRDDFLLDMGTYGGVSRTNDKTVCVGCMATVTMQSLFNVRFSPTSICGYSKRFAVANTDDKFDFHLLEQAVDTLRGSYAIALYEFCGIKSAEVNAQLLPLTVPQYDGPPLSSYVRNLDGRVLSDRPTPNEVEVAIYRLTKFAELVEAKGF